MAANHLFQLIGQDGVTSPSIQLALTDGDLQLQRWGPSGCLVIVHRSLYSVWTSGYETSRYGA